MSNRDAKRNLRVGFVGLGNIGEPMARRLIEAGFPVTLWARREASLDPFRDVEFQRASSRTELGRNSDVLGVAVFGENDVDEVILGAGGILEGMSPGGIILVHSTVSVESVVELGRRCSEHGVTVMDAPVSGFRERAESGQLTVMVGGPAAQFDVVRPVLDAFGSRVVLLGPLGSGQKMKALNNTLLYANITSSALALHAGRQLGLDPRATEEVLSSSSGASAGLGILTRRVLVDPQFADLAERIRLKDLTAFEKVCRSTGIDADELRGISAEAGKAVARLLES
jgi:3-hydroxyisobutyrate dehydrogenase